MSVPFHAGPARTEAQAIAAALLVELDVLVDVPPAVDAAAGVIRAVERVETLWQDLRALNEELLRANLLLRHELSRATREGLLSSDHVVGQALVLLGLDPVKVAKEARARHQAELGKVQKDMKATAGAMSPMTPWEERDDG